MAIALSRHLHFGCPAWPRRSRRPGRQRPLVPARPSPFPRGTFCLHGSGATLHRRLQPPVYRFDSWPLLSCCVSCVPSCCRGTPTRDQPEIPAGSKVGSACEVHREIVVKNCCAALSDLAAISVPQFPGVPRLREGHSGATGVAPWGVPIMPTHLRGPVGWPSREGSSSRLLRSLDSAWSRRERST